MQPHAARALPLIQAVGQPTAPTPFLPILSTVLALIALVAIIHILRVIRRNEASAASEAFLAAVVSSRVAPVKPADMRPPSQQRALPA